MTSKLLIAVLLSVSCLSAQEKISFSVNPGWSVYNSENAMEITRNKKFRWLPGLSFAYERENVLGHALHIEYNVAYRKLDGVLSFVQTSEAGPEVTGVFAGDLSLTLCNLDVDLHEQLNEYVSMNLGPTLSCATRTFAIGDFVSTDPAIADRQNNFSDRLVSWGLGANASLDLEIPLSGAEQHLFIFSSLKLRYLHSLWIDGRGRNVDEYYQSFLYGQVHVGLGWAW